MRIAILSNVTVEVLAGMLRERHSVWIPTGYGCWAETAFGPPRDMLEFNPEVVFLLLDKLHSPVEGELAAKARASLEEAFPNAVAVVPDLDDLADEVGEFYDERMWKLCSMPWSLAGLRAIELEIERLLRAVKGERRKVLAVDFDNTLWSGVIGEDGLLGIQPRRDFQAELKKLGERGVVLVGLSRNNADDVAPVWSDPRMVLKESDFAAFRIDWNDKAENLVSVANELGLGVDSFVFLDDSPVERARMKAALPEVAVPDFEPDTRCIRRVARMYFPELRVLDEDRRRTSLYRDESERRRYSAGLSSDEYLKGLGMRADIHQVRADEFARVAQLSQKSNQFNVTTNRYVVGDIVRFASDPSRVFLTAHLSDRFGEMGLVGFVHAVVDGESAAISDFVMSCRAMNRRLEAAMEEALESRLLSMGVKTLNAVWRRTAKNAPVECLFEELGFTAGDCDADEKRCLLQLPRHGRLAHHIEIAPGHPQVLRGLSPASLTTGHRPLPPETTDFTDYTD